MNKPQRISLIVAMAEDRLIGRDNQMPWHISEDLKLFKSVTTGNTVIMGRKTFESIGKPLPNRTTIVISGTMQSQEGVVIAKSVKEALDAAKETGKDIFFIGGGTIYKEVLPLVDFMHISWVKGNFEGDTYFPEFKLEEWQVLEMQEYDAFTYCVYKRV